MRLGSRCTAPGIDGLSIAAATPCADLHAAVQSRRGQVGTRLMAPANVMLVPRTKLNPVGRLWLYL